MTSTKSNLPLKVEQTKFQCLITGFHWPDFISNLSSKKPELHKVMQRQHKNEIGKSTVIHVKFRSDVACQKLPNRPIFHEAIQKVFFRCDLSHEANILIKKSSLFSRGELLAYLSYLYITVTAGTIHKQTRGWSGHLGTTVWL